MKIIATKSGNTVSLSISGHINRELRQADIPTATLKRASNLSITLDANITDVSAATLLHNIIRRHESTSVIKIISAESLGIYVAVAADEVSVEDTATIAFNGLPGEGPLQDQMLARLEQRLGVKSHTLKSWFATRKLLAANEAALLFRAPGGALALLNNDGSISPEKIYARWNTQNGRI